MITKEKIKVGDRVKFKEYESYSDWKDHRDEVGTITEVFRRSYAITFDYAIMWNDGRGSHTHRANLILVTGDWDQ